MQSFNHYADLADFTLVTKIYLCHSQKLKAICSSTAQEQHPGAKIINALHMAAGDL